MKSNCVRLNAAKIKLTTDSAMDAIMSPPGGTIQGPERLNGFFSSTLSLVLFSPCL